MNKMRKSYVRNCITNNKVTAVNEEDIEFMAKDSKSSKDFVLKVLDELNVNYTVNQNA
jgi:hypothetical protein